MRKLKIIEHISLDGVIQQSADDGDFPYGDWTAPYRTPAGLNLVLAAQGERFDLLLGRRTYDIWSGYWPKAPSSPMADALNAAKKYVATHRTESLEWGPVEGLGPDIVEGIRHIKSQDGPGLILWGSSTLTSTLLEHELADEVVLIVYPVLLGTGKRFFAEGTPARAFELVSTQATTSGVIFSTYKVARPLKTGQFDDAPSALAPAPPNDLAQLVNGRLWPTFRKIWFTGGGAVSAECLRLELADEVICSILPILIDDGISFFEKLDNDIHLHLAEVKTYKTGMMKLHDEVQR